MSNTFNITTEVFKGPLELLLELIEKRKLFVSDISLSEVADEFVEYIENAEEFPLETGSQFIVVASTLLLIKSKSLLPNLQLTDEEQSNIDELQLRLKLYKRYKKLSEKVGERYGKHVTFAPTKRKLFSVKPTFSPTSLMTVSYLASSVGEVLSRVPKIEDIPQATVQKMVRLEDMIEQLIDRVQASLKTSFKEFAQTGKRTTPEQKKSVIVSFLAMLELVKRGIIRVQQHDRFNDIEMETNVIGTPSYE